MAPSQVNYFTKSGTNRFHGDLYELWNGSLLNAEDYFLHANDTPGNVAQEAALDGERIWSERGRADRAE